MTAVIIVSILALLIGIILAFTAKKYSIKEDPKIAQINHLLPQTQCAQCGYPGCLPYAEAIAKGEADINLCPPGGEQTVKALAELLHLEVKSLAKESDAVNKVAWIDENQCIGCVLCIKACPVDAIIGATKQMHTIIEKECTGCELCIPVCPVDCIYMIDKKQSLKDIKWQLPEKNKLRDQ